MDEVFATYIALGLDLSQASKTKRLEHRVVPPAETVAAAALYVAMRQAGISKLQLAKRLGVNKKEVLQLLASRHDSKLPRIAKAISLSGQRLLSLTSKRSSSHHS